MTQARGFGVECDALSAEEAKAKFPYITTDGVEGAAYIAGDGYVDPYGLTQAYAKEYGRSLKDDLESELEFWEYTPMMNIIKAKPKG